MTAPEVPAVDEIVAATVTYGDRASTCLTVVEAALANGAARCVIVDNGSSPSSRSMLDLAARQDPRISVVHLESNSGSAVGFSTAIAAATSDDATSWLWLLDDDNLPRPGALASLLRSAAPYRPNVAVAALRSSDPIQLDVVAGARVDRTLAFSGSFLGFDLVDRFRPGARERPRREPFEVPWAPYGGLLVSAESARSVAGPYHSFVLYGDDRDWCERLRQAGTRLMLDPNAIVDDLVDRWSADEPAMSGGVLERMVRSEDRRRAYYLIRNTGFQDWRSAARGRRRIRFGCNVAVYTAFVVATSLRARRPNFIRLYTAALTAGVRGRWYSPNPD